MGIYFEAISTIKLYNTQWTIATFVNLSALQEEWQHIRTMVDKVGTICTNIQELNNTVTIHPYYNSYYTEPFSMPWDDYFQLALNCGAMHHQITIIAKEIEEYNVQHFRDNRLRRKRGLLNIVGELSRDLFGTLSHEDATNFLQMFKKLDTDGANNIRIINKQTSLIQSNFNLIKETRRSAEESDTQLLGHIQEVNRTIESMRQNFRNAQYAIILKAQSQDMMTFLIMLMQSYQTKQKNFLEALSLATKGGNSPIIIPPEVFMNELIKIRNAISGKNIDLPIPLIKDNLAHYYQLASPQSRLLNN